MTDFCPTVYYVKKVHRQIKCIKSIKVHKLYLCAVGKQEIYWKNPHWRDLVLFYEYFDGDSGRGCGARSVKVLYPYFHLLTVL